MLARVKGATDLPLEAYTNRFDALESSSTLCCCNNWCNCTLHACILAANTSNWPIGHSNVWVPVAIAIAIGPCKVQGKDNASHSIYYMSQEVAKGALTAGCGAGHMHGVACGCNARLMLMCVQLMPPRDVAPNPLL